jgi:protein gp37
VAETTKIEWTNATWNPVSGCSKVSPGCDKCYAIRETNRHRNLPKYAGLMTRSLEWTGEVRCHPQLLGQPMHWKAPRRVFVCSMSDLFHDKVPWEFIIQVFYAMKNSPQHTFQVLTKRPGRMAYFAEMIWGSDHDRPWPANVWAGTSVESQKYVPRLDCLLRVPAKVRFVSAEPLLGPVDLLPYFHKCSCEGKPCVCKGLAIHWIIAGGESGPGARPMDLAWTRGLVGQCQRAGVPVFVKQLGAKPYTREPLYDWTGAPAGLRDDPLWLRDRKGGDMAEWPADLRVREFPACSPA